MPAFDKFFQDAINEIPTLSIKMLQDNLIVTKNILSLLLLGVKNIGNDNPKLLKEIKGYIKENELYIEATNKEINRKEMELVKQEIRNLPEK